MLRLQVVSAAFALLTASLVQARAPQYFLSTVRVPQGANAIVDIVRLDARGNAIGNVLKGQQVVPEIWGDSFQLTLPPLSRGPLADGKNYRVDAANALGGAAGQAVDSAGEAVLVYWSPTHSPMQLVGGDSVSGVSDSGTISGNEGDSAVLWETPISNPTALHAAPTDFHCDDEPDLCWDETTAISPNSKYVGGVSGTVVVSEYLRGDLWVDGQEVGGPGENIQAINNSGVVVGGFYSGDPQDEACLSQLGAEHAFSSGPSGRVDLGGPSGDGCFTFAIAVNASGVVVGTTALSSNDSHAAIWENGKFSDLNNVLAEMLPAHTVLTSAVDVTDNGKILMRALDTTTNDTSYLIATPAVPTRISISSNINPSSFGQPIHLVATVTPDSGPKPTGQVQWFDNGKLLGTARMTLIGTASWEPSTWTAGVHKITARYLGAAPAGSSSSANFNQTVKATRTRTTLSASVNTATHGKSFTLTATVVPAFGTIAGNVTFKSNNAILGTAKLDGRTKQARLTTALNKPGKYTLEADYGTTREFAGSTSAELALAVR